MCTVFVSAVRRYLPHAELVVDHFHDPDGLFSVTARTRHTSLAI
jgi:hypothetical protein